jgi:hypothetical protein
MVGYASTMPLRRVLTVVVAAQMIVLGGWLIWRWQPDRAALSRFEALCEATADRKPRKMEKLIAADYADRWGMDRATALREARQILGQFFALTLEPVDTVVEPGPSPNERIIRARIRLGGTGTGIAELAKAEVNRLESPWVFTWRRTDWRPWNWQLVRLENPGIDLTRRYGDW